MCTVNGLTHLAAASPTSDSASCASFHAEGATLQPQMIDRAQIDSIDVKKDLLGPIAVGNLALCIDVRCYDKTALSC